MSLSVGIVGLPNAGKSTLFNALASRRLAETAARPFTTIEPHEAVVAVPDKNLEELTKLVKPEKSEPATVTFIDIAGLVKGAHKGEGLGNQFLAKIREVDAIVHVVRAFVDPLVSHPHPSHEPGSKEQVLEDIEIVNLELELGGISQKPTIYILNVEEKDLKNFELISSVEEKFSQKTLLVSAEVEEQLIDFSEEERKSYLKEIGEERSAVERLIVFAYDLLGLITFYTIKPSSAPNFAKATMGKKASEGRGNGTIVTAWSIKKGASALDAAGVVHTDFAKNFIKAEVINVEELLSTGSWKESKDKGKIRLDGKDYIVQDKDVIEFKVGV